MIIVMIAKYFIHSTGYSSRDQMEVVDCAVDCDLTFSYFDLDFVQECLRCVGVSG